MRQNTRTTEGRQRTTTTSPTGAEYRGSGPRTAMGAVAAAVTAVALVTAVLAPVVAAVVGVVTVTGGAVVGAAATGTGGPPGEVVDPGDSR